ncbi:ABI gene family member 3 [Lissotriton helveticus]
MSDLVSLQQSAIPSGRKALRDSFSNLQSVAEYCEHNYLKAENKQQALKETMSLASQSLASVAYQINSLAVDFLKMLELEATELRRVEENIYHISHTVDIHKEKVSRREIGAVTDSRSFPRTQKIIALANKEQVGCYSRKPVNLTILDNIGHGIKDSSSQLSKTGTMSRKASVKSSSASSGSLGRSSRPPDPVQPPVVPEGRFSTDSSAMSSNGYSGDADGFNSMFDDDLPPPPPPDHSTLLFESQIFSPPTHPTLLDPTPPPPPPQAVPPPPPPPPLLSGAAFKVPDFHLPPPPDDADSELPPPPPPVDYGPEQPFWAPNIYMEKVIALYAYTQQKEDEISFSEGDVIYVTVKDTDGWYQGVANGFSGYFPGNYVGSSC